MGLPPPKAAAGHRLKAHRDVGGGFRPFVFDVGLAQHDVAVACPFARWLCCWGSPGADMVETSTPVLRADLGVQNATQVSRWPVKVKAVRSFSSMEKAFDRDALKSQLERLTASIHQ
jgi:hypothetical protein